MPRIFHRRKSHKVSDSIAVVGFHKSMRDVIQHFMSTGELLLDPSYANSYDNTDSSVRVEDFDVNSVVQDTSLLEAALMSHNESKPVTSKSDPKPDSDPAPVVVE